METYVEAYTDQKIMTAEVLLELTQSLKGQQVKRAFNDDIGLHSALMVTQEEIENMGEALKMIVFVVTPSVMREAMYLAQKRGVLILTRHWATK
jgi:hypothetical protein